MIVWSSGSCHHWVNISCLFLIHLWEKKWFCWERNEEAFEERGGKWLDISPPLSCPSGAPPLPPPPLSPPLHLPWDQRYLKVSKIKHYGDSITRKCAPYSVWTNVLPLAGSGAQIFLKKINCKQDECAMLKWKRKNAYLSNGYKIRNLGTIL